MNTLPPTPAWLIRSFIETTSRQLTAGFCRQALRDAEREATKREAARCDCWKASGPICARCKLRQVCR